MNSKDSSDGGLTVQIQEIRDDQFEHLVIGYKFPNNSKTFFVNENNPFTTDKFPLDTTQSNFKLLHKQGSFMYDISNASYQEIEPFLSPDIPLDSIFKYRLSRMSTYCNHSLENETLIISYILSVHAFKNQKSKVSEVISLSSDFQVLNSSEELIIMLQ